MKKNIEKRKLTLNIERLRELQVSELSGVQGGLSKLGTGCLSCNCVTPDCQKTH